jgi:hypothetical protein
LLIPAAGIPVPPALAIALPLEEGLAVTFSLNESKNVLTSGVSLVMELVLRTIATTNLSLTM